MRAAEWLIYGLSLPSAKENHHNTWNTIQDLCVFVSNQEMFTINSCAQRLGAFKLLNAIFPTDGEGSPYNWYAMGVPGI